MQNRKPNLMGSITNLVRNFVEIVETRLALFALDMQETGMNLLSLLILCGVILTCLGLSLILATLLVVVIFWDSHRLLALGGAVGFFAVAGLGLWFMVLARFRSMPRLFAATRGEFAKDREWLSRNDARSVADTR
jgi:uncharacterized membrane protein YqjE